MKDNLARQSLPVILDGTRRFRHHVVSIVPEIRDTPRPKAGRWRSPVSGDTSLWLSSLLIVLVAYGAPLIWWLIPERTSGTPAPPPAAMVVELAPAPVAPASQPEMPPGPEQAKATPPPKPEPQLEPEPEIPPAPPATKPEVAVNPKPEPEPEPEPEQKREEEAPPLEEPEEAPPEEKPASTASAPPDAPQEDVEAAAPARGVSVPAVNANAIPTWQNSLMLKLNEAKRYPAQARRQRHEGVAYLRFSMDREGKVLTKSIEQSAGYPLLDEETLALIDRAQPLPEPPVEMQGERLEFVVPVEFFLNR